jgi:hypothetical protein
LLRECSFLTLWVLIFRPCRMAKVRLLGAGRARRYMQSTKALMARAFYLVKNTVAPATHAAYARKVQANGGFGVERFLDHMNREMAKPPRPPELKRYSKLYRESTSTFRHLKAACMHMAECHADPWAEDDSQYIETLICGFECENAEPRRRAILTLGQFNSFLAEARAQGRGDIADAAIVHWAACVRPRDMKALCLARIVYDEDTKTFMMWAEKKVHRRMKVRRNKDEKRVIMGDAAQTIIKDLYKAFTAEQISRTEPFFPEYNSASVEAILRKVAKDEEWPEDLLFDGPHCFRHGCALEAFSEAIQAVRIRGGWGSNGSAVHYSQQGVAGRTAANAATAFQAATSTTTRGRRARGRRA